MNNNFIIVKTTTSKLKEAQKISQLILENKLAGCVQIQQIKSSFVWQQKICDQLEFELSIKTHQKLLQEVCQTIKQNHSYQIPQIISLKIEYLDEQYKSWLESCLKII